MKYAFRIILSFVAGGIVTQLLWIPLTTPLRYPPVGTVKHQFPEGNKADTSTTMPYPQVSDTKHQLVERTKHDAYNFLLRNALDNLDVTNKCPKSGLITIQDSGRLGNQISQYATLYGYARRDNLLPVISEKMTLQLERYFSNLAIPTYKSLNFSCELNVTMMTESVYKNITGMKGNIYITRYPHNVPLFNPYKHELLSQLRFRQNYIEDAEKRIAREVGSLENVTLVGMHIRRRDYGQYMHKKYQGKLIERDYLLRAMDIYKKEFKNVKFVLLSDDITWCREQLRDHRDVYFVGNPRKYSPGADMAVLSLCDHAIITYGTYGFWGAYFAGGDVVLPGNYSLNSYIILEQIINANMSNWKVIEAFV